MTDMQNVQGKEKARKDTKEVLIRVLQIMEGTDARTPMNSREINDALMSEFGMRRMDRKTISDNLTTLMSCGYPIRQMEDRRKGWYMADHRFADWELKIMMDAVQQARFISAGEAETIRKKLLGLTSKRGRSRFAHLMERDAGNAPVDYETGVMLEDLLEAIYSKRKISFQYTEIDKTLQKVLRRDGDRYVLNVYAIYWAENTYYIIGAHDHREELTQYRLDRVVNLSVLPDNATPAATKIGANPELQIREFIERSVYHYSGEVIRLEVSYEPSQQTNAILYDFAGDDVQVRECPNGRCIASFKKMNSVTLVGWFMQYGTRFKVLAPRDLRENVFSELKKAAKQYV